LLVYASLPLRRITFSHSAFFYFLCVTSGCSLEHSRHFVGIVMQEPNIKLTSPIDVIGGFEISHTHRGLVGLKLRDIGAVVFVYNRMPADYLGYLTERPNPEAYLFLSPAIDDIDLDRFVEADTNKRAKFSGVFSLNGNITVKKWNNSFDFYITIDAKASDPQRTRLKGVLQSYDHPHLALCFGPL
jgi:hypothetical protein